VCVCVCECVCVCVCEREKGSLHNVRIIRLLSLVRAFVMEGGRGRRVLVCVCMCLCVRVYTCARVRAWLHECACARVCVYMFVTIRLHEYISYFFFPRCLHVYID